VRWEMQGSMRCRRRCLTQCSHARSRWLDKLTCHNINTTPSHALPALIRTCSCQTSFFYPPGAFTSSLVKGRACHFGGSRRCSTMTFILSPMLVESTASSAADHIRPSRLHVTVTPAISRVTLSAEHLQLLGFRQSTTCRIYALTIRVITRYLASSIALHQNRHDRVVFAHHKIFLTPSAFLAKPQTFFNIPTPRARFASDLTSDQVVQLATGTAFRHAVARRRLHPRTQPS
jgi:hypothetical protein